MVELGRAGRSPDDPAKEFEPTAQSIRNWVARLMRTAGLAGVSRRKWITTTGRDRNARPAPDLVERNFVAPGPNRLWVADITYLPTWAGFLYLAVVLDAFSRRIVGWAMATHLRTELVLEALNIEHGAGAAAARRGDPSFRPGHTVHVDRLRPQVEARMAVFEFIERWDNPQRRHSALDYLSPINYERSYQHGMVAAEISATIQRTGARCRCRSGSAGSWPCADKTSATDCSSGA